MNFVENFAAPPFEAYPVALYYDGAANGVFVECREEKYWLGCFLDCYAWLSSHPGADVTINTTSSEEFWGVRLVVRDEKLKCSSLAEPTKDDVADYLSEYETDGEEPRGYALIY